MTSCHLAICARTWDVPVITEFLRGGISIWDSLAHAYGITCTTEFKDAMKKALYMAVYGDTKSDITKKIRENRISELPFYAHPVIAALFEARQPKMQRIWLDQCGLDCFGRILRTSKVIVKETFIDGAKAEVMTEVLDVKSILAQLSQSWELKILYPAVELAIQNQCESGFAIMLWQWDGFSIACKDWLADSWTRKIKNCIDANCKALGFETELEWK